MNSLIRPYKAAEMLGISLRTIYRMVRQGRLKHVIVKTVNPERMSIMIRKKDVAECCCRKAIRPSRAAVLLGVSRSTIYRWFHEGVIQGFKIGEGPVRIFEDEIDRLQEINTESPRELGFRQHG